MNWRSITISTDGHFVKVVSNELSGDIETVAVLNLVAVSLNKNDKQPLPEDSQTT